MICSTYPPGLSVHITDISLAPISGRKLLCLGYCVFYALGCITKLSSSFYILFFGRILCGIATSILFSAFESWMVHEHHSHDFPAIDIGRTFYLATFGNGLVAILSGYAASAVADSFGFVAPFMLAAVALTINFGLIYVTWTENYGSDGDTSSLPSDQDLNAKSSALMQVAKAGFQAIIDSPEVLYVGAIQGTFEGAMYLFVFIWSPILKEASVSGEELPFGIIFSCFMVAIMMGSQLFSSMIARFRVDLLNAMVLAVASLSFLLCLLFSHEVLLFACFMIFEGCCGLYFPALGTQRSNIVPEEVRAAVMNIFRIPLNLFVVIVLLFVDQLSMSVIMGVCAMLLAVSVVFQYALFLKMQVKENSG